MCKLALERTNGKRVVGLSSSGCAVRVVDVQHWQLAYAVHPAQHTLCVLRVQQKQHVAAEAAVPLRLAYAVTFKKAKHWTGQ